MKSEDRTVAISEGNFDRLLKLYGELNRGELQRIVNRHLSVVIDEIMEDENGK